MRSCESCATVGWRVAISKYCAKVPSQASACSRSRYSSSRFTRSMPYSLFPACPAARGAGADPAVWNANAPRWALDGEERTWARGEVSPGSGHARADANLRRPGGVTRERERAVLPDQRQYGKTALQWCPASLRTLPAFSWKPHYRGRAARIALTASSILSPVAYTPDVHVTCQIYLSWRTTYYTP